MPLCYLDAYLGKAPWTYTQHDFEAALADVGFAKLRQQSIGLPEPVAHQVRRVLGRTVRNLRRGRGSSVLCLMMGPAAARLIPDGVLNRCALHCWDTWPDNFKVWDSIFTRFRTEVASFTSRNARDRFQTRFPLMHCYWMPDGASPELHRPDKPLISRRVDVLELGRRYGRYHDAIVSPLKQASRVHLFERVPGQIIFPDRRAMVEGLADTKIVISFPMSVTTPPRSSIETITPRYFEAMASGCLIVGRCPEDLRHLLGFNPVIEANLDSAAEQIKDILGRIREFQPLVDRNLGAIRQHTWRARALEMKAILEAENGIEPEGTGEISAAGHY